jgi:hypothetical protein
MRRACCDDPEHTPNRQGEHFRKTIRSGLERLRKAMRDFLFTDGVRNLKVVSPF